MTPLLVAIDTDVLAYAEGLNDPDREATALALLRRLDPEWTLIPVQALGELFTALVKKGKRSPAAARDAVLSWGDSFPLIETSSSILTSAADLANDHRLPWWDAVILSAAAEARCRLLLSEDLQDGFTWSGVTVANPFAAAKHPLLEALIG